MVAIGPWIKGMNNRSADHDIHRGTREDPGAAVRNAVNVDFGNGGKARRRKGYVKIYSGFGLKGGFSSPKGVLFCENNRLLTLKNDNTARLLCHTPGSEPNFFFINNIVYFSDGIICRKIDGETVCEWGIRPPAAPVLYGADGTFGQGVYLGAVSFVDSDGVESGASPFATANLVSNTGIVFSNLPGSDDPQVTALRLYLSMPNGGELYHVADVLPGTVDYTITAGRYDDGNILDLAFVSPPPPGRIIRSYNGRMMVADAAGTVWYSDPFQPDHFRLSSNFISFTKPVDIMEPVATGIFFSFGDQTEFYSGDFEDGFTIFPRKNYGGIYGTGKKITNSENVCWQSQRGMVIGTADGQCRNVQEKNVATEKAVSGATLIREENGLRQFIAALHQPTSSTLAAKSWIDAEVIRRG